VFPRDSFERRGESTIGCDTACDHESALHLSAESFDVSLHGARGPVSHDVGDSFLEARAEIGDVLLAQRRASESLVPERMEAGEWLPLDAQHQWDRHTMVTADESYLRESILMSQAKTVKGYEHVMPTFQGLINEDGVAALIEYIKSMQAGGNRVASAQ